MADPTTLTDEQYEFLNFLEQYWFEYGLIPTGERAKELGIPEALYSESFKSALFRSSCRDRGISLRGLEVLGNGTEAEWKRYMLTEQQLTIANIMLDISDSRSHKKKLQDANISTALYQSWLRDPAYQNYIRARAENTLSDNQHEAHLALVDRVRSGDMTAIKYFNEITGRYVPSSGDKEVNVSLILMRVLEIIQRHVRDSSLQEVIAQEFLQLSEPVKSVRVETSTTPAITSEVVKHPALKDQPDFFGVADDL
jgi:hypothetical protein